VKRQGIELMEEVRRQLDEAEAVLGAMDDVDLTKHCPNEDGEVSGTVAAAAAHLAEGYGRLGRFLHSTVYAPAAPERRHEHTAPPETVADVLYLLHGVEQTTPLLGELTDEQLDTVPAKTNKFTYGERTLRDVITEMIAHQAAHLAGIKRALA
jgi:hypothetical protein